ncbi:MqnA/MqnD/SBP family protein [Sulfurospirillum barnesii]|uniref:Chorismate dehydratase n=1 Tax=Sulfurospirillum barnesii (strain ATCC 700032 / DSM 10660 / SES-3) TaxID=760154 RepID=I3XV46_SULBS|nr:MqnA/MqnD/SBP family protein [Sulfurospirillum barnesii]AFL67820.1 putative periplasmic solute-binding protein [Sulfurospirillum barnesii SES-3]
MLFGKIDYINLLPFHVFLKKASLPSAFKRSCEHHKDVPSNINAKLRTRKVHAAVISSVESTRKTLTPLNVGIVAKRHVKSVLVKKNSLPKKDPASATSNKLANVLGIEGEVFIGDRALKLYLNEPEAYIDLAQVWTQRYHLPFVFARFCVNEHQSFYKRLAHAIVRKPIKIPRYILETYAKERGISTHDIQEYLKVISYTIGKKEQKALFMFLKKVRMLQHNA